MAKAIMFVCSANITRGRADGDTREFIRTGAPVTPFCEWL